MNRKISIITALTATIILGLTACGKQKETGVREGQAVIAAEQAEVEEELPVAPPPTPTLSPAPEPEQEQAADAEDGEIIETRAVFSEDLSPPPYLGSEEIRPLFGDRQTVADWTKNIAARNVRYNLVVWAANDDIVLNISSNNREIALFYLKYDDDLYKELSALQGQQDSNEQHEGEYGFTGNRLPARYLAAKVGWVRFVDFAGMGVPFNLRGITKGTSLREARAAFLDFNREDSVMYTREDAVPNGVFEGYAEEPLSYIYGKYVENNPESASKRYLFYENTLPSPPDGVYSINHGRTYIQFPIDENGNVAGLIFADITHDN
jgi:hypothetical protein